MSKAEVSLCIRGAGSTVDMRELERPRELGSKVTEAPRYLGNWPHWEGRLTTLITHRVKAIHEGYWSCKGFWTRQVPLQMKRGLFFGMVLNTALSGLEAECPSYAQVEELDVIVMHYARKLLGCLLYTSDAADE